MTESHQARNRPGDELQTFCEAIFVSHGLAASDARIFAQVLLAADLRGIDTHGISRLKYYSDRLRSGLIRPAVELEVVKETATTATVDTHLSAGPPAALRCMNMAIDKAARSGLGCVAVRGATHFGIAGFYAELATRRDMIGLCACNARPAVAPTFSTQPVFGTNPLAFAAPSDEPFPFLFDAAMSVAQRGDIEVMAREQTVLPEGWVAGADGQAITQAIAALRALNLGQASLLPLGGVGEDLGGHKGFGLGLLVEILSSALQNGSYLSQLAGGVETGAAKPYAVGHFFLALNVENFIEVAAFRRIVGNIVREVRAARRVPEAGRIWTAGEKEWATEQKRRLEGIPLSAALQQELEDLAHERGVPRPWKSA